MWRYPQLLLIFRLDFFRRRQDWIAWKLICLGTFTKNVLASLTSTVIIWTLENISKLLKILDFMSYADLVHIFVQNGTGVDYHTGLDSFTRNGSLFSMQKFLRKPYGSIIKASQGWKYESQNKLPRIPTSSKGFSYRNSWCILKMFL